MRIMAINPLDAIISMVICASFDMTTVATQVMLERRKDVGLDGIENYIRDKLKSQSPEFTVLDALGIPSLIIDRLEDDGFSICRLIPDGPAVEGGLFENRKVELYYRLYEYGDRGLLKMKRGEILRKQLEMRPPIRDERAGGRWRLENRKDYEERGMEYGPKPELDTSAYCFVRKTDFQEEELPPPIATIGENPEYPDWDNEEYDPELGHFGDDYLIIGR